MKRTISLAWLAAVVSLTLAACSSTDPNRSSTASTSSTTLGSGTNSGDSSVSSSMPSNSTSMSGTGTGSGYASGTGSTGSTAGSGSPGSSASASTMSGTTMSNGTTGVVQLVEQVPRSSSDTGTGTVAGAAVGGSSNYSGDRVYRVTVRLDDGSTRYVMQEGTPSFQSGDKVKMDNGALRSY